MGWFEQMKTNKYCSTGAVCLGPPFLSRWCLLGLDCPTCSLHSHSRLTVSWCGLFAGSSLGLPTSAYVGPYHLNWASHRMVAKFWEWVFQQREFRESQAKSYKASYDPASEVPESCIQLVKQVTKDSPNSKGGEKKTPPLKDEKERKWPRPLWRQATTYHPLVPSSPSHMQNTLTLS